jgi:YD repeat-containing protein
MAINARGTRSTFEYDGLGRPVNIKDDNGDVTKNFSYNQGGANGLYYNTVQSANFVRNNCSGGQMGSSVTYTVAANTYSSTVSQAAADAAAMAQVTANGQANANTMGTCSSAVSISYINDSFAPFDGAITQLRVKDALGNVLYTFTESQLIAGVSIPQGTYTLSFTIVNLSQHSWGTCMIYSSSGYNEFYSAGTTNYEVPGVVMTGTTATIYLSSYS